jgi:hypothetical protein
VTKLLKDFLVLLLHISPKNWVGARLLEYYGLPKPQGYIVRFGQCSVFLISINSRWKLVLSFYDVNSAPIVKRSWNQEKYTLPKEFTHCFQARISDFELYENLLWETKAIVDICGIRKSERNILNKLSRNLSYCG